MLGPGTAAHPTQSGGITVLYQGRPLGQNAYSSIPALAAAAPTWYPSIAVLQLGRIGLLAVEQGISR